MTLTEPRSITRFSEGTFSAMASEVVRETPLTVMLNDEELATLVCSPYAQKELVVGFLVGEGLLSEPSDLKDFFYRDRQEVVWVETASACQEPRENFMRRDFTSCCGKGRPTLYFRNDARQLEPVSGEPRFTAASLLALIRQLEETSLTYRRTGGVHSAALADAGGLLVRFEDIGRHNALDRILGHTFLHRIPTDGKVILLSGRASSELVIKAARIGAPVVVSRSAPTGLAIDLAERLNLTLAGFARGEGMYIYTHDRRITP